MTQTGASIARKRTQTSGGMRGRPSAARAAEIDKAIANAAIEAFLDAGYEAVSMDGIAAAAGVSKGTLYARHESKESLFRCVLEQQLEVVSDIASMQDHLLPPGLEDRLRHHARVMVSTLAWPELRRVVRLMETATPSYPDLQSIWYDIGTRRYVGIVAAQMEEVSPLPEGVAVDWNFLANLFMHSITSWHRAESARREVSEAEVLAYCDNVIDLIVTWIDARVTSGNDIEG